MICCSKYIIFSSCRPSSTRFMRCFSGVANNHSIKKDLRSYRRLFLCSSNLFAKAPFHTDNGVSVFCENNNLQIKHSVNEIARFNGLWLRHHCKCNECEQPHSGQKLINPNSFPLSITLKQATVKDGVVYLEWNDDSHCGHIPLSFLLQNQYSPEIRQKYSDGMDMLYKKGNHLPTLDCTDVMNTKEGLLEWLYALDDYGAALIKNCPTETGFLEKIVPKITQIMPTIYGKLFTVKDDKEPINVAYSNVTLDLHMDLIYYESAPGLQFLHCCRFDDIVTGGESVLLDGFLVAQEMMHQFPKHFETMLTIPATFQKIHFSRDSPVSMKYQKPHFVMNKYKKLTQVNWAPAFEGPLSIPEDEINRYYEAYHCYAKMLNDSLHKIVFRLCDGDLLSFNNRRILHGRNSFSANGGVRYIEGCYANIDEFKSRVEVLSKLYGDGRTAKRVGNQDLR